MTDALPGLPTMVVLSDRDGPPAHWKRWTLTWRAINRPIRHG